MAFLARWIMVGMLAVFVSSVSALTLVEDGKSDYVIVVAEDAPEQDARAAKELQNHVRQCCGVELPIVHQADKAPAGKIIIGKGPAARSLGVAPSDDQLGEQGCVIRTVGDDLVIAGTPEIGTLYGVHRFIEDALGVRWLAPGVTRMEPLKDVDVDGIDTLVKPAFAYRYTTYSWPGKDAKFLTRMGHNSSGALGLAYRFLGICHTYFRYVSPGEFFETHPEYFSEINGERLGTETQLCLTNPEVLDIVTERMLAQMRKHPEMNQFNFSQMDYYNQCKCSECRAMNKKYGTDGGTQFWFVNQLAQRTSKEFPDKLIGTLAYTYTETPPVGMKMHPNVAVWLCHMFPCCDSHPIRTCPLNAGYKKRAQRWTELCKHVYIWHYITDFAHYQNPFPNFRAVADDLRFYRDIGVEGLFLQGSGHRGGEFSLLRPYVMMRLAWDPDRDLQGLIDEFLTGYYGPAAEPIAAYIDMLHDYVQDNDIHMHLYTNPAQGYLTDDIVARAQKLFDQAEAAVAGDAELLERVKVARMPVQYARMFPRNGYDITDERLTFRGNFANMIEVGEFLQRLKAHGVTTVREHHGDPAQLLMMTTLFSGGADVVMLENAHLKVNIVPTLSGRILRIIDKSTGECVTANNVLQNLYYPFTGGFETRVGNTFMPTGWIEPAVVIGATDNEVTMLLQTVNGYQLQRRVSLAQDAARVSITTKLTNSHENERTIVIRSHGHLNVGELRATQIGFTDRQGHRRTVDIDDVIAGMREGVHLYEGDCPAGAWHFTSTKGLKVTHSFADEQIEYAWLYAFPETERQLELELWSPEVALQAGESLTIDETISVAPVK